ncbi:MAG TPA: Rne/Rng family ribonuclease [Gammaproteobacteria bacterium]|jgi:ribonuclease E|nr:Rne/Rng family ribonuclease [Gammaproteobacteria bacterium]
MKRILINATQPEELRVAMVDGQRLYDLDLEVLSKEQKKANIYKGRITRVEPSLEACFVDYGSERHGFLPLKEISRSYFRQGADTSGRINIREVLQEGQEVMVQVDKEERGNKGAALTTFISLAGRFMVLMPNNPRAGGVSRRVEGDDREELRDALSSLQIPEGMGVIIRTAAGGRSPEELQWDLDYLVQTWDAIDKASHERSAPFLIYQEGNVVIRALRDYLRADIGEILVDDDKMFQEAQAFMQKVMPQSVGKLKRYDERVPLFTRFQIESQIEAAFGRHIRLPSGGALVIDHTEALVAIDVNSARATKGSDIEETALRTNLEAADEVARQLRLRDLGGLIVIDFIDMGPPKNQREVEDRLRTALEMDRARVQVGKLSRFGLLEMSRQRLRPSLGESTQVVCPQCEGEGRIRGIESLSLSVLRLIEEEAMKERTSRVVAKLPVNVATFLLNEKRGIISEIEKRCQVTVVLVPHPHMDMPKYDIQRIRDDEARAPGATNTSYKLVTAPEPEPLPSSERTKEAPEAPAVKGINPSMPAPVFTPETVERPGIFVKLWRALFGTGAETEKKRPERSPREHRGPRQEFGRRDRNERDRSRGRDRERGNRHRDERGDRDRNAQRQGQGQNQGGGGQKREERGDRNQQARGERQDRHERGDRHERSNRGERGDRHERGNRGERGERHENRPQQQAQPAPAPASIPAPAPAPVLSEAEQLSEQARHEQIAQEQAAMTPAGGQFSNGMGGPAAERAGEGGGRRGRRRGRRGGRRRRFEERGEPGAPGQQQSGGSHAEDDNRGNVAPPGEHFGHDDQEGGAEERNFSHDVHDHAHTAAPVQPARPSRETYHEPSSAAGHDDRTMPNPYLIPDAAPRQEPSENHGGGQGGGNDGNPGGGHQE